MSDSPAKDSGTHPQPPSAPSWLDHNRDLTIARVTPGMAHDFNNLLVAVLGNAALMESEIDEQHPWAELLSAITRGAERASRLTRHVLEYARSASYNAVPSDWDQAVEQAVLLSRCVARRGVTIEQSADRTAQRVLVDVSWLRQIVLNIVLEAQTTIPQGGRITLTAEQAPHPTRDAPAWGWIAVAVQAKAGTTPEAVQATNVDSAGEPGLAAATILLGQIGGVLVSKAEQPCFYRAACGPILGA